MTVTQETLPDQFSEGEQVKRMRAVIERDRTLVAQGIQSVKKALASREWLRLGRGSYEWNDDRWKDEFGEAFDEILESLEPLRRVASDWSDSPMKQADIEAARAPIQAALNTHEKPEHDDTLDTYQSRVWDWLQACFSETVCKDKNERNHRFLEESLELVQACGCTQSEAHQLVDYVYGRKVGEPTQEVGGVMNTLAALCSVHGFDLADAAETELSRVWTKIDAIRAKQAAKPKHSPLPTPQPDLAEIRRKAILDPSNEVMKLCDVIEERDAEIARMKKERLKFMSDLSRMDSVSNDRLIEMHQQRGRITKLKADLSDAYEALRFYRDEWEEKHDNSPHAGLYSTHELKLDAGQLARTTLDKATAPDEGE